MNKPDPAFAVGYLVAKALLAILMAWLITTYNLPLAIAALLIFFV